MELKKKISNEKNNRKCQEHEENRALENSSNKGKNCEAPDIERKFTKDEYVSILEGAEFLREFDTRKDKISKDIVSRLSESENVVPLSRVYGLAGDLGIDKRYVDRYLEMRFPSEERKLEDLEKWGAQPAKRFIKITYLDHLSKTLNSAFPGEKFEIDKGFFSEFTYRFYRLDKKIKKSWLFWREKIVERKTLIASLELTGYSLQKMDVYDPSFLIACGDTLDKLEKAFKRGRPSVIYHYNVNLLR